ncbi:MAG TPA: tRNA pseudouridine(38-40) synthase TruA [Planctomycetes bacterium]|nr:tRNA pseudouridine(38-40) synthase TruA [Planctomycetota bacterium]
MRNIKLTVHYDGSNYHGWQVQPDHLTVQAEITGAIARLTGKDVIVNGASRTDAGVSALGQVANVRIDTPIPTENFVKALTEILPNDIAVTEAVDVPYEFDAITSAKHKLYRYSIYTGPVRPVLDIRHCWHLPRKLDADRMDRGAKLLVGTKDFKSFASAADKRQSSVRTVTRCDVKTEGEWIYIAVEADGFLYNMVRNIVGTLVEIGRGRWRAERITEILEARDRTAAGPIAPAAGLCLIQIEY